MFVFIIFRLLFVASAADVVKYGTVSYQNAVIYEITNPKNIYLKLISEIGDADLYVFKWTKLDKSTINFADYQFKSDSFGVDSVTIGKDFDVPLSIVVFGVAQVDSKFVLEISSRISKDLDYPTIDEAIQKSPGSSYEELCLQHSFDSDLYYAEEERARLKLLSMDTYPEESSGKTSSSPLKHNKNQVKDSGPGKSRKQKQMDNKRLNLMDEDSFLYHFLLWLLDFIVDVFF